MGLCRGRAALYQKRGTAHGGLTSATIDALLCAVEGLLQAGLVERDILVVSSHDT